MGELIWDLLGQHNINNALAAIAAAHHVGVQPEMAVKALCEFQGVKRRMELKGEVNDIYIFDDFAHHPTAIHTTLEGLKNRLKNNKNNIKSGRLIAVFEPRSNTLKSGFQKELLARSFGLADQVFLYQGPGVKWDIKKTFELENISAQVFLEIEDLILNLNSQLMDIIQPGHDLLYSVAKARSDELGFNLIGKSKALFNYYNRESDQRELEQEAQEQVNKFVLSPIHSQIPTMYLEQVDYKLALTVFKNKKDIGFNLYFNRKNYTDQSMMDFIDHYKKTAAYLVHALVELKV